MFKKVLPTVLILFTSQLSLADIDYKVDLNADANHCELYVDELGESGHYGYHGAGYINLFTTLNTRPSDDVANVGMFISYHEEVSKRVYNEETEEYQTEILSSKMREEFILGKKEHNSNRYVINFTKRGSHYGKKTNTQIERFAFFVDIRENGQIKRLWLKNGELDFSNDDISKDNYYYSDTVRGYNKAYMWRDSGSPIFDMRNRCQ